MIIVRQEIIVPHNDPFSKLYRSNLTKEKGWLINENTQNAKYTKTEYIRLEEKQEKQNETY